MCKKPRVMVTDWETSIDHGAVEIQSKVIPPPPEVTAITAAGVRC